MLTGFVALSRARGRLRQPAARPRPESLRARFAREALVGAALMALLHVFVIQVSVVRGSSMEPSLHDGDRLVVDRIAYEVGEVHRGDVVVMRYPRDPGVDFVKRIVGLPGDEVAMHGGVVHVNGAPCDLDDAIRDGQEIEAFTVPPGQFFVLGDNRPISCDSRDFGLVAAELLRGRVRARFWPLQRAGFF